MDPEAGHDQLISKLTQEQKGQLQGAIREMEHVLALFADPKSALPELRKANTTFTLTLMGTPLENVPPFSTITHQVSELGTISKSVGGQHQPSEFNRETLVEAVQKSKDLLK